MSNNFSFENLTKGRTAWFVGLAGFLLAASLAVSLRRGRENADAPIAPVIHSPVLVAGPGRVEPYSEDIKIGSELSGRVKLVFVEEGDAIHRGQVLAELENADYRAQVESARAGVMTKEATLRQGGTRARQQERNEACA